MKKRLIFVPSTLPHGSPPLFFNPALIPSSLPLFSSASPYFCFLLFSVPVPYSPILTSLLIPCSPWHPLLFPSVLFPHLLLSASHFRFWVDPSAGFPLISSSVTHYASPLLLTTPVCLWLSLPLLAPLLMPSFPSTSSPLDLLFLNPPHLTQSLVPKQHVFKQRSGETKSWLSTGICPASPFCLLIYSFVCVPLSLHSLRLWRVSNCPQRPRHTSIHTHTCCTHTYTHTHTHRLRLRPDRALNYSLTNNTVGELLCALLVCLLSSPPLIHHSLSPSSILSS